MKCLYSCVIIAVLEGEEGERGKEGSVSETVKKYGRMNDSTGDAIEMDGFV